MGLFASQIAPTGSNSSVSPHAWPFRESICSLFCPHSAGHSDMWQLLAVQFPVKKEKLFLPTKKLSSTNLSFRKNPFRLSNRLPLHSLNFVHVGNHVPWKSILVDHVHNHIDPTFAVVFTSKLLHFVHGHWGEANGAFELYLKIWR